MMAPATAQQLVRPIPQLSDWTAVLSSIAARPLAYCEDFPTIAARFEAWWAHEALDRPIFIAQTNSNPVRPITRRLDLLDNPDAWFDAKHADMLALHRVGDALPHIRVDFGPVLLGALLGGRTEYGADTSWTHACINDDWSNAPDWKHALDQALYAKFTSLLNRVATDAAGKYLLCTPDLGGSADVLLNLRGSTELCTDVIDQPDRVRNAIELIYPRWREAFIAMYVAATSHGAGIIHWLQLWSNKPYGIPACDFNYMIGPDEFQTICLPEIAAQVATSRRGVFHLDGPGAARHIDALLEVPHLEAIQFTPGEGTPSALAWLDMFKKVQAKGRSLLIITPPHEVIELCESLRPEGLAILLSGGVTPASLDDLYGELCKRFGG